MMLARRFPPLRHAVVRTSARGWPRWRRSQHGTHGQPLPVRRHVPREGPRPSVAFPGPPRRMIRGLMVACCVFILVLSVSGAAGLVAGEMMRLPHSVALGSEVSPVFSRTPSRPLTPEAHVASPPGQRFTTDDCDWDDEDASDMRLVVLTAHGLPVAAVRTRFDGATHACVWPIHYLVRPQLLARL